MATTTRPFRDLSDFIARAEPGERLTVDDSGNPRRKITSYVMVERTSPTAARIEAVTTRHHGTSRLYGTPEKCYRGIASTNTFIRNGDHVSVHYDMTTPGRALHQQDTSRYNATHLRAAHTTTLAAYAATPTPA